MILDLEGKAHLSELFDRLRSGRHVCAADGPLYLAIRSDYATHRKLFGVLGFDLVEHDRGFYYFRSTAELGKEATELAVFFFILVEAWSDDAKDIETTAFDAGGHRIADLPHLIREGWRRCMAEAGVTSEGELAEVVRRLERYGFAERIDESTFRFRAPAWRFLDLCAEAWSDVQPQEEAAEDSHA